jgi:outer membrane receptor protein involved in Fe transport
MNFKTTQFLLLSFCLLLSNWAIAQKATIYGVVTDAATSDAIFGANVAIRDMSGALLTGASSNYDVDEDKDGFYKISVDAGTYKVVVSYIGYAEQTREVTLAAGEKLELNFDMQDNSTIDVVIVTDGRFEKALEDQIISITVVDPQNGINRGVTKVDQMLEVVPGVTVVDGQANIRGGSGYSYGAGSRVLLLVDDMPFLQPDAGFPNWRDMPVENLAQIEVLKGAGSALYGSSALNGIIHVRTAYATKDPETQIAVFGTGYGTPARANTAWWRYDSLQGHDTTAFYKPAFLSGRAGYRKPMEAGLTFAHRRQFKEKLYWTVGANLFYGDSYRAGEYERKFRINSNLEYRLDSVTRIGINGNFNTGRSSSFFLWGNTFFANIVDSAIYIPLSGTVTESEITRFNIDPYFTRYGKKGGKHRIQSRYYRINNQNGQNQGNSSNLFYGEYQYSIGISDSAKIAAFRRLRIVGGAVGQTSFVDAQLYGNAKYNISNIAAYAQFEKGFFPEKTDDGERGKDRLLIAVGMRVERNTINSPDSVLVSLVQGKILNPEPKSSETKPVFRAGANYRLAKATNIRASWGQGYRYPTIAERYISTVVGPAGTGLEIRANPSLKSETGWSSEIGIMQGFLLPFKRDSSQSGKQWKGFIDASFFWSEYQDMMEFAFKGGDTTLTAAFPLFFQSINVGNTLMRGAEFSIIGQGKIGKVPMNLMTGYTFIDPRFKDFSSLQQRLSSVPEENILKYRSQHTLKFDAEAFFLKDDALSIGATFIYTSAMQAIDVAFENLNAFGVPSGNTPPLPIDFFGIQNYRNTFNKGENMDLGGRISYRHSLKKANPNLKRKDGSPVMEEYFAIKLSLIGKNLLNREVTVRPALIGQPRTLTVRLDFEF